MIAVETLDDARVAPYRWVAEPERLAAAGLVVVEGRLILPRLLTLAAGPGRWHGAVESVLLSPAAYAQLRDIVGRHPGLPAYVAPQAVMDGLVGFNVHRGCLALARRPPTPTLDADVVAGAHRVVVLERVNNPDNVGGIFRSAAALGADLVVLGPACADPLYRKSVRTSMGATLELPYVRAADWPQAVGLLRQQGFTVAALTTGDAVQLATWPVPPRVALLAGAEGPGLSAEAQALADLSVTIPMRDGVDSLNVTTAVSIALYHVRVSHPS